MEKHLNEGEVYLKRFSDDVFIVSVIKWIKSTCDRTDGKSVMIALSAQLLSMACLYVPNIRFTKESAAVCKKIIKKVLSKLGITAPYFFFYTWYPSTSPHHLLFCYYRIMIPSCSLSHKYIVVHQFTHHCTTPCQHLCSLYKS